MACLKKQKGDHCGHYQCPFASETAHGYECVEIMYPEKLNQGFCESGENCHDKCQYSWKRGDNSLVEQAANTWIKEKKEELQKYAESLKP